MCIMNLGIWEGILGGGDWQSLPTLVLRFGPVNKSESTAFCSLVYLSSLVVPGLISVGFLLSPLKDWALSDQLYSPSQPQAFLQCHTVCLSR